MSTERRRNAGGGRRRASGPSDDAPRGGGGRRRAGGPAADERAVGRRRDDGGDSGFWDDERPRRRSEGARSEGPRSGGRRRPPEGRERDRDHGARSGGARRSGGGGGGRRRPPAREEDDRGPIRRFWSKAWKPMLIGAGVLFIGGVVAFFVAYAVTPGPDQMRAQSEATQQATVISYAGEDGEAGEEIVTTGEINRQPVSYEEIPDTVINGVLGTEQRTFPSDGGISITGTMRAVLSGGSAGGGSTITQQMARNYYDTLTRDQTITRKAKEIMISIKLGQKLEKEQIVEQYLNTIYFGRGAYGVQAASQAYFGKDVGELDQAEGAFIGAIIQQPGNFENYEADPDIEEILKERWRDDSVGGMVKMHEEYPDYGISKAEADKLEFPETVPYTLGEDLTEGHKGYVRDAVINELKERYGLTDEQIVSRGLRVTTSLDAKLMNKADKVFGEVLPEGMPEDTNYGLTSVDPATGEIKAFRGGTDFTQDRNNSLIERAQAGSAFKPYVLATGLGQGISLQSEFDGSSPQKFEGIEGEIQNDSNRDWGVVNLTESTKHSVNTAFVQLAIETTPAAVVETAKAAGIAEKQFETADIGPNIALGTYQVSALDQATGYATFANGGVHIPAHMVTKVEMPDDQGEYQEVQPKDAELLEKGERAFSQDVAADATYAMQQVVSPDGGGKNAMLDDGRPVAGKTGTSNNAKSAWFAGYTPQLATAVGLFRDSDKQIVIPGEADVYGGTTSAKVWKAFMDTAMEGEPVKQFPAPAKIGSKQDFLPVDPSPSNEPSQRPTQEPSDTPEPPEPSETPTTSPPSTPPGQECNPWWEECDDEGGGGDGGDPGGTTDPGDPGGENPGGPGGGDDDETGGGGIFGRRE
ncbi:transglycosylase domain-containing protein [Nocardiopsis halophila]|uniref:transglycosylase domain-containing protein n=1 Tax=Nocardiopsis halophila TaxID=141692 RepID=UPI000347DD3D|nr:transglycosylase domain-containing protein [Nocardiopsis halophila]